MHIAADNNQVAVKIMAELPAVREIIESNLSQLKSDLQNQGVNVNQLDVAVFSDSQRKGRRGRTSGPAAANKVGRTAEGESDEAHGSTERVPTGGPGNGNRISFFA